MGHLYNHVEAGHNRLIKISLLSALKISQAEVPLLLSQNLGL